MKESMVITLPQFPEQPILVTLFKKVTNASEIRSQLIAANPDYNYSFIDASMVLTVEQLLASVYKTLVELKNGNMKSKTINSELILNLSPFSGIMDSLKKIGINDKTTCLILVRFLKIEEDVDTEFANLQKVVKGDIVEISDVELSDISDFKTIKKIFKLGQLDDDRDKLSRLIIGITQLK